MTFRLSPTTSPTPTFVGQRNNAPRQYGVLRTGPSYCLTAEMNFGRSFKTRPSCFFCFPLVDWLDGWMVLLSLAWFGLVGWWCWLFSFKGWFDSFLNVLSQKEIGETNYDAKVQAIFEYEWIVYCIYPKSSGQRIGKNGWANYHYDLSGWKRFPHFLEEINQRMFFLSASRAEGLKIQTFK